MDEGRVRDPMPNIGPGSRSLSEEREEGLKEPRSQGHWRKPIEFASLANGNVQSLNQKTGVLYGTNLNPLQIRDNCIAWSICRALGNGMKGCPYCFGWLLGTYS